MKAKLPSHSRETLANKMVKSLLSNRQADGSYFFFCLVLALDLVLALLFLTDLQPHVLHIFRPFTF
jgi:hypothetical protein